MLFISKYKLLLKMKNYSTMHFCINTLRLNMFFSYARNIHNYKMTINIHIT